MGEEIVVMGATGHVGSELSKLLLQRGKKVRVVARTEGRLRPLASLGAEVLAGDLSDASFLTKAFAGAKGAFLLIPPDYKTPDVLAYQRAQSARFATALRESGVAHAVTLSSVGAELPSGTGPIVGLHALEEDLKALPGLHVVHLRAAYFMENHLSSIGLIKTAHVNGSSMKSDVRLPMVATKDIAGVGAECLASLSFHGQTARYVLGPRDYSQGEATTILGASIGQGDLKYVQFPYEDQRKALVSHGLSESMSGLLVEMQKAFNEGVIRTEERGPSNTTPTTLEEFARDVFAPAFRA